VKKIVCGVDVSKKSLDMCILGEKVIFEQSVSNDSTGISQIAAACREHGVVLVIMEATSRYHLKLFRDLSGAGIGCNVVNPASARSFAKALNLLEKSDKIDAAVLSRYGQAVDFEPQEAPDANQVRLNALSSRLSQLANDIAVNKKRQHTTDDEDLVAQLKEVNTLLKEQEEIILLAMDKIIQSDPVWSVVAEELGKIKGIGPKTLVYLRSELPKLGQVSHKSIGRFVGLAPIVQESGGWRGNRSIRGGRQVIRSLLYLIGGHVAKWDSKMAEFQQRLRNNGKKPKVIRIAMARKLLTWLNAKARDIIKQSKIALASA
jgi:transposase